MQKDKRTYFFQPREHGGVLITLLIYQRGKSELSLHLEWSDVSGKDFIGIAVHGMYLTVLGEYDLMQKLARLPLDISLHDCERHLISWGFVADTGYSYFS